jgi:hypothetical protein
VKASWLSQGSFDFLTLGGHGTVVIDGVMVRQEHALEIREAGYCETNVGMAACRFSL